jgi:hypothetical protein
MGWSDTRIERAITILIVILWLGLVVAWRNGVHGVMPVDGWTVGLGLLLVIWRLWRSFGKRSTHA